MDADLVLKGARVIDPASGTDAVLDVAVGAGQIIAVGADLPVPPSPVRLDLSGAEVTPGVIDPVSVNVATVSSASPRALA